MRCDCARRSIGIKRKQSPLIDQLNAVRLRKEKKISFDEVQARTDVHRSTQWRATVTVNAGKELRVVGRPLAIPKETEELLALWARWCFECRMPKTKQEVLTRAAQLSVAAGNFTAIV